MSKRHYFILFMLSLGIILFFSSCEREEAPVTPTNHKPYIDSLSTGSTKVLVNSKTKITYVANDADGDSLAISWSSKRGKFYSQTDKYVYWKAPAAKGTDTLFVTITDGKTTAQSHIVLTVGTLPLTPTLIFPGNEASEIELSARFKWKQDKDATSYTLQVSSDDSFKNVLFHSKELKTPSHKIDGLKSNTTYFWRVKSRNDFGITNWSKVFSFKTVAPPSVPLLVSPSNSARDVLLDSELRWNKINNANNYWVQVSEDQTFAKIVFEKRNIADSLIQANGLNHFLVYYWRVKAINNYGESDWSDTRSYTAIGKAPAQPSLLFPHNNSANNELTVKLVWENVNHATNYSLEVSDDSSFTELLSGKVDLVGTSFELSGLSNWRKYFWRVRSANQYGESDWSVTNSFTTKIASPSLTATDIIEKGRPLSPEFLWDKVNGAKSYNLQVALDSNFSNVVFSDTAITSPSYQVSRLSDYTNYYWRVAATDSLGNSFWSQPQSYKATGYYYQGLPYGNQAIYNPAYVILNGGFDMIQVGNQRDIKNFPYKIAFKNIWENFKNPFKPIGNYGWWNFFKDQVFPLSLNKKSAQFWPNYSLHLIGGGMEYAATREWYKYNNFPYPSWLSAFTIMSYHLINEVTVYGRRIGEDVDPIADFFLFDIGGIVLFSSESVKRFFAEDLNLADWSQQPSFSLKNAELHNNGQFFSVKWKFPFSDSWHAFYYFGTNGVGGLSYKYKDGSAISFGVGLAASDLIVLDEKTNKKTLGLVGNFAAFYDRNNSLLAALSVTIKTDYMINLNIYPGVVKLWGFSPGLWGAYSQDGNYIFGFTVTWLPFGFAYSTK